MCLLELMPRLANLGPRVPQFIDALIVYFFEYYTNEFDIEGGVSLLGVFSRKSAQDNEIIDVRC